MAGVSLEGLSMPNRNSVAFIDVACQVGVGGEQNSG